MCEKGDFRRSNTIGMATLSPTAVLYLDCHGKYSVALKFEMDLDDLTGLILA